MTKLPALFLLCLAVSPTIHCEPVSFTINTKKLSHVLDDHFISITVNPRDLLQGKVYGLAMNSIKAILKGLSPAYVRIGSADTAKYTFKRNRYPNDIIKPEDEYTITETHWVIFNEMAKSAGLSVIVCLNAAHRNERTKQWDTRNSLELISFSDSQGYNLTWQLGYEVQPGNQLSGIQFGKDLNRLRIILNAFPRYQHAKLIGPDIKVIHKKEDLDFWNDVLIEAGPTLDAVTWHPRWPLPSKIKVSDNSDLGYEFPTDYLEYDRLQLDKILQRSKFKNPVWIGETKGEVTGTFAEGLIWARRLALAAKLGVEVVMKQPNLMDITHPKTEYWIALLHKRLLGKNVLETRSLTNNTDLVVISHCTSPLYWKDKPEKPQDGAVTVYAVNLGGLEQKIQIRGTYTEKSQLLFQYVLTSGSSPDSVFSQMTYLNGEPLKMTDDGLLPDIIPKIRKVENGLTMNLPPYSIGFWVVPDAKVQLCQSQSLKILSFNVETVSQHKPTVEKHNIKDINQFPVDQLTNPISEGEKSPKEAKIEEKSSESSEKNIDLPGKESKMPRLARRIRQAKNAELIDKQIKKIMEETQNDHEDNDNPTLKMRMAKSLTGMEHGIRTTEEGISDAVSTSESGELDGRHRTSEKRISDKWNNVGSTRFAEQGVGQRVEHVDRGKIEEKVGKTEKKMENEKPEETKSTDIQIQVESASTENSHIMDNSRRKISKKTETPKKNDIQTVGNNGIQKNTNVDEYKDRISPWIKTTEGFIREAFTTLRRQRQLSEILASESANNLKKEEMSQMKVGKRGTDESFLRQLRGLQPGVYIVPTAEMTNIRSEQITNEAEDESGGPNVLTLNIYYDKKNPEASANVDATGEEQKANQDFVTYDQNKAWDPVANVYDQSNRYIPPPVVPEVDIATSIVSPDAVTPDFQPSTIYDEFPNSRWIQFPFSNYVYPPNHKLYPSVISRNIHPVYGPPMYYLRQQKRILPRPGTKRQWREFKAKGRGVPSTGSGWNVRYETVPGSLKTLKNKPDNSINKNGGKLFSDRWKSIGRDPKRSDSASPFWKFFARDEKRESTEENGTVENESGEEVVDETAKVFEEKKTKNEEEEEEESQTRKKRSLSTSSLNDLPDQLKNKKLQKRSYIVQMREHDDIAPVSFGTYEKVDNAFDQITRNHDKLSDEELHFLINSDDDLIWIEIDLGDGGDGDDHYYNDNAIMQLRRYSRRIDDLNNIMFRTNMIYKTPDDDFIDVNISPKPGMKKLSAEDNSLEKINYKGTPFTYEKMQQQVLMPYPQLRSDQQANLQSQQLREVYKEQVQEPNEVPSMGLPTPIQIQIQELQKAEVYTENVQNGIEMRTLVPKNDSIYFIFKYAYDSLVKVMKTMTQLL